MVQTSAHPLRFNTGDTTVDACLLRLEALAAQPCQSIEDGVSIEEWIEDVLREMRALPHDLLRRLKPEALYSWDSPRRWASPQVLAWHAAASAALRQRLAELIDPRLAGLTLLTAISSSIGVTHSSRHYLQEGLAAMYEPELTEVPEEMLEQVARIAAAEGEPRPPA